MTQYFNSKRICDLPAGKNQAVYCRGDNGTFLACKVTPAIKSSFLHHLLPRKQNWSQMGSRGPAHSGKIPQSLACSDRQGYQVPMSK